MKISNMKNQIIVSLFLIAFPIKSYAVEYNCNITRKITETIEYSPQQLSQGQFSVLIEDNKDSAFLSRCSYAYSEEKITCDRYSVDKIVSDDINTLAGNLVHIKKYYVFRGQFDVQLFSDLAFIENSGRGDISFGKCKVISP